MKNVSPQPHISSMVQGWDPAVCVYKLSRWSLRSRALEQLTLVLKGQVMMSPILQNGLGSWRTPPDLFPLRFQIPWAVMTWSKRIGCGERLFFKVSARHVNSSTLVPLSKCASKIKPGKLFQGAMIPTWLCLKSSHWERPLVVVLG